MNSPVINSDIQLLKEKGFSIKQFTDFHYRINGKLDIWPTKSKYHYLPTNERGSFTINIMDLATAYINEANSEENGVCITGITLRDYFAMIAPEVPDWFKPTMREKPKPLAWIRSSTSFSEEETEFMSNHFDEENEEWLPGSEEVPEALKKKVEDYLQKFTKSWEEFEKWEAEERVQALIQWRWFYADEMLKGRK